MSTQNRYEQETAHLREEAAKRESVDLPLFVTPIREMARRSDPDTSKKAAVTIADHLPRLQARVLAAFQKHGPMTASKAERLPEFGDLGFSTVRKRISELAARDHLRDTGRTEGRCTVYGAAASRSASEAA